MKTKGKKLKNESQKNKTKKMLEKGKKNIERTQIVKSKNAIKKKATGKKQKSGSKKTKKTKYNLKKQINIYIQAQTKKYKEMIITDNFMDFNEYTPVVAIKGASTKEIKLMTAKAYKNYYFRFNYFKKHFLSIIKSFFEYLYYK